MQRPLPFILILILFLSTGCASVIRAPDTLHSSRPATVTLVDGRTLQARQGFQLDTEELVLQHAGGKTQRLARHEVRAINTLSRTRGMRRWALAGAALGALLGARMIADSSPATEGWLILTVPLTFLTTTGLGAAAGLLAGEKVRYELNPPEP